MSPETDENLDSEGRLPGADVGSGGTAGSSLQHREEDDPQGRGASDGRGANEEDRQTDDEKEEEAQPNKRILAPDMPTKAEVIEHKANDHIPYRSWCKHCVEGFGR